VDDNPCDTSSSSRHSRRAGLRSSPSIVPADRIDRDIYLVLEDVGARWLRPARDRRG
jgi:hypothetical protein